MSRHGDNEIRKHNKKVASVQERDTVLKLIYCWGYNEPQKSYKERLIIAKAACRMVAYDAGFKFPLAYTQVAKWDDKFQQYRKDGENYADFLKAKVFR